MITVLGSDPGTNNFATSVIQAEVKKGVFTYDLVTALMIKNTLTDMTSVTLGEDITAFRKEYKGLVRKYKPDHIVAERYMNRGAMRGATGELVSAMLGIMSTGQSCKDIAWITAAQWKNAFNKHSDLDYVYKESPFVAHVVDSLCIGLYRGCQKLGVKPFEFLNDKTTEKLLDKMEQLDAELNG